MSFVAKRIGAGTDLRAALQDLVIASGFGAATLSCLVGSLTRLCIRTAGGTAQLILDGPFEIVSGTGTLCQDGMHVHISVADQSGNVVGGHLLPGCLIYSTAEIVLSEAVGWNFSRELDAETGYLELKVEQK